MEKVETADAPPGGKRSTSSLRINTPVGVVVVESLTVDPDGLITIKGRRG